jgi:mRNA interferase RelE/StbE
MATPTYTVRWTETAVKRLKTIPDRRTQRAIHTGAGQLDHDPEQRGIALLGEFMGFRRVEAVGKRYRIIYRVERAEVAVAIVLAGLRKAGDKRDVCPGEEAFEAGVAAVDSPIMRASPSYSPVQGSIWAGGLGGTEAAATNDAVADCRKRGGKKCEMQHAVCSR